MKQFLNMESLRITSILVLLYTCSVSSFPSRPLNERSADLAWQAWLLVDDQNQEKNYGAEALGRRRITPKSVFIAPTFSPENLPPCASGYHSDNMGRCVKLIEIDEAAHLDFLLQKLNERFGYEEFSREDDDDEKTISGPLQLNIPLDETPTGEESESEKNVGVAIVVTPTNGRLSLDNDNDDDDNIKQNRKKSGMEFNDMKNVRNPNYEDLTIKTENFPLIPDVINPTATPIKASTDLEDFLHRTTVPERTASTDLDVEGTTTESLPTEATTNTQQALFFREPEGTEGRNSNSDNVESTTLDAANNQNSPIRFIEPLVVRTTTDSLSTNTESTIQKRMTEQYQETNTDLPEQHRHHNFRHDPDYVNEFQTSTYPPHIPIRFPLTDIDSTTTKKNLEDSHYQNNPKQNPKMYANRFQHLHTTQKYITPGETFDAENTPWSKFVFKNRDPLEDENFRRSLGIEPEYDRFQIKTEEHSISPSKTRRNIDTNKRNTWFLASADLSNSSPHKPLVFRFPHKSGSRRLLSETIQQPQKTIYREISPEDLKVLFGNHRHKRKSDR